MKKNNEYKIGLKGLQNLARGNAPGANPDVEIVRRVRLFKELSSFRTKRHEPDICPEIENRNFVRSEFFAQINAISRTVFFLLPLPWALPRAEFYWPSRPETLEMGYHDLSEDLKMEMKKNNEYENGLKGLQNLARGNAPGANPDVEIVRGIRLFKGLSSFRTKRHKPNSCPEIEYRNFVRSEFFAQFNAISRTIFCLFPLPWALPRASLYWPFRPLGVSQ